MTILRIVQDAIAAAKTVIIENLDKAAQRTGDMNPFGEQTLLLDRKAEDTIIEVFSGSSTDFDILTEEKGFIKIRKKPEYLAIIDPIDGSINLERGIPLSSIGVSVVPYKDAMTSDDIEISMIDSLFTNETFTAITGKGVTRNGIRIRPSATVKLQDAIISCNTKKTWDQDYLKRTMSTISAVQDLRRTASPLLDLCWTAAGFIDGMVDLRDMLPIIHLCGTHMVFEAGGFVFDKNDNRFCEPIEPNKMMNFVAASNEALARQILAKFKGD